MPAKVIVPEKKSGGGLGSLLKIGVGALTGGLGGAAMGAASSGDSPFSRALGAYQMGSAASKALSGGNGLGKFAETNTVEMGTPQISMAPVAAPAPSYGGAFLRRYSGMGGRPSRF